MYGAKSLLSSKTFWGVAINVALKAAGIGFAVNVDPGQVESLASNTAALVSFGSSFIFDAIAVYGRVKAKDRIGRRQ